VTETGYNKERPVRGIKRKILGISLLSVGLLNTMLTLKAGTTPDGFNYIVVGLLRTAQKAILIFATSSTF